MLFNVIKNTIFSAVAFLVISVIGLLLIPFIIDEYGIAVYGMLVLLRLFTPQGILACFDLGLSENSTIYVARSVEGEGKEDLFTKLIINFSFAVLMGTLLMALLLINHHSIVYLLNVPSEHHTSFQDAFYWTALTMPIFFVTLVFDGILKGYERFDVVRGTEVCSILIYSGCAVAILSMNWSFHFIHFAFLLSAAFKLVVLMCFSMQKLRRVKLNTAKLNLRSNFDVVIRRCYLLTGTKVIGICPNQLPPLILSTLLSPAVVGIFDTITKLPKFLKASMALINSAILPFFTRLDASNQSERISNLGTYGMSYLAGIIVPPLFWLMVFSEQVLMIWLGEEIALYHMWFAGLVFVAGINTLTGFMLTGLISRDAVVKAVNKAMLLQVLIQYSIGLVFLEQLQAMSFVLGQIVAVAVTSVFLLHLIYKNQNIRPFFKESILKLFIIVGGVFLPLTFVIWDVVALNPLLVMMLTVIFSVSVSYVLIYMFILKVEHKTRIKISISKRFPIFKWIAD